MQITKSVLLKLSAAVFTLSIPMTLQATSLQVSNGGTFTFNLDSVALGNYAGGSFLGGNNYYLSSFANTANSNPTVVTGGDFLGTIGPQVFSSSNLVHDITPVGADPSGQLSNRHVKGTTAGFRVDSDTLAGVAGEKMGMTGLQGFFIPNFNGNPSGLANGDFSLQYDSSRTSNGRSGWYLNNNLYFTLDVYDLANLSVLVTDQDNWQLTGDLLMAPSNASMLFGPAYTDIGNFHLGVGSYAVSSVPVPGAFWMLGSGLTLFFGMVRRKTVSA